MKSDKVSKAAASGAVALIFLILGFQIAIFSGNVFKFRQQERMEADIGTTGAEPAEAAIPDAGSADSGQSDADGKPAQKHTALQKAITASSERERDYSDSRTILAEKHAKKKVETFEFDPNTVSLGDLCRLGFSERQAQVILNYRSKGGKFRTKGDFAKMYVVDSSSFARLEPYIRIARTDLNAADSEALLALKGIGPYYAHKILDYRRRLGGSFTSIDQLLEIDGFDESRLAGFRNDVELGSHVQSFNLWEATREQLEAHPYIGSYAAKGIIRFKRTVDTLSWSLSALVEAGILSAANAAKL